MIYSHFTQNRLVNTKVLDKKKFNHNDFVSRKKEERNLELRENVFKMEGERNR